MQMKQNLEQTQKLVLTQMMRQSLQCLQMSAPELQSYLEEASLSNPFLEIGDFQPETSRAVPLENSPLAKEDFPVDRGEQNLWTGASGGRTESTADFTSYLSRPQTFTEYLNSQLGQMPSLHEPMLSECLYLVGCLNSSGYLDFPLEEIAQDLQISLFDAEQALYVVQSLDPPGVGARSLSECLLLQLAQSRHFSEVNVHLIQGGLPLLAEGDYAGLAKLLHVRQTEAQCAAEVIRSLNPIPSRGFYTETKIAYVLPEAAIVRTHDQIEIEMNERAYPHATLNKDYCALVGSREYQEEQAYLKEKLAEAKSLLTNVQDRYDTLYRLLCTVVENQKEYFLHDGNLQPMTMKQLAEQLQVNISTVSRTVKDKYIQFNGKVFPLRKLFTVPVMAAGGQTVSAGAARQKIRCCIAAEDPHKPLSDEALVEALTVSGILISRRTVAKYRSELGIPSACERKRSAR